MADKLDKITSALIYFYISRLSGVLGKTHLQKLLFLTDLMAIQQYNEKITDIDYVRYFHGPYSQHVNDYTTDLESRKLIEIKQFPFRSNQAKTYTRFYVTSNIPVKEKLLEMLGADKMILVEDIVSSYGNMSLHNLLDLVYGLQAMKDTEMNKPMKMAADVGKAKKDEEVEHDIWDAE